MKKVIDIYGWNNCNTCRQTNKYLEQKGYQLNIRDFFKDKFTKAEILAILDGRPALEMFNPRHSRLKELGINTESLTSDEMIELMLEEPRLIRRPIVRIDGRIYFGANIPLLEKILA